MKKAFRKRAVVQRCQWHKRENVVSYLSKSEQAVWCKRLQRAYNRPEYEEVLAALEQLHGELEERNQSAAGGPAIDGRSRGDPDVTSTRRVRGAGQFAEDDELP